MQNTYGRTVFKKVCMNAILSQIHKEIYILWHTTISQYKDFVNEHIRAIVFFGGKVLAFPRLSG